MYGYIERLNAWGADWIERGNEGNQGHTHLRTTTYVINRRPAYSVNPCNSSRHDTSTVHDTSIGSDRVANGPSVVNEHVLVSGYVREIAADIACFTDTDRSEQNSQFDKEEPSKQLRYNISNRGPCLFKTSNIHNSGVDLLTVRYKCYKSHSWCSYSGRPLAIIVDENTRANSSSEFEENALIIGVSLLISIIFCCCCCVALCFRGSDEENQEQSTQQDTTGNADGRTNISIVNITNVLTASGDPPEYSLQPINVGDKPPTYEEVMSHTDAYNVSTF